MNGLSITREGTAAYYSVKGVPPQAGVKQAKKYHAKQTDTEYERLRARKFFDEDGDPYVFVHDPERAEHRLAHAEPRTVESDD